VTRENWKEREAGLVKRLGRDAGVRRTNDGGPRTAVSRVKAGSHTKPGRRRLIVIGFHFVALCEPICSSSSACSACPPAGPSCLVSRGMKPLRALRDLRGEMLLAREERVGSRAHPTCFVLSASAPLRLRARPNPLLLPICGHRPLQSRCSQGTRGLRAHPTCSAPLRETRSSSFPDLRSSASISGFISFACAGDACIAPPSQSVLRLLRVLCASAVNSGLFFRRGRGYTRGTRRPCLGSLENRT